MLVLSRKRGERVVVSLNGETVTIELLKIRGAQVSLGFKASKYVAVHREEVWNRLDTERVGQCMMPVVG